MIEYDGMFKEEKGIIEKIKYYFNLMGLRWFLIATIAVFLISCLYGAETRTKNITLTYDIGYEKTQELYSVRSFRVLDFVEEYGIDYDETVDRLNVDYHSFLDDENDITIYKSYDVKIDTGLYSYEGNIFDVDTVDKLLNKLHIYAIGGVLRPGEDNKIIPLKEVKKDDIRIEYVKEDLVIPCEIIKVRSDDIHIGESVITKEGHNGLNYNIYLNVFINDTLLTHTLVRDMEIEAKEDFEVSYGYKFEWDIPENLEYIDSFDIKAVSYNFDGRPYGVYGLNCTYGTVAVDRDLIPLGTKMFIEGYGYAIANDVGSGIHGNIMDMYMEQYEQCLKWGAQYVTVYVLEYGDNTTNWTRPKREESIKVYDEFGVLRRTDNWPNIM